MADLVLTTAINAHRDIKRSRSTCGICGTKYVVYRSADSARHHYRADLDLQMSPAPTYRPRQPHCRNGSTLCLDVTRRVAVCRVDFADVARREQNSWLYSRTREGYRRVDRNRKWEWEIGRQRQCVL